MKRRDFLTFAATGPLALAISKAAAAAQPDGAAAASLSQIRENWKGLLAAGADVAVTTEPLKRNNAQWKELLTAAEFDVLREEGTERPFSSPLNSEKRPGVYVCAGCALPLFTSAMKFDSGTGWPSFFTEIPGHLATETDFKLLFPRTEYHCVRCGGHQGHVFDDGPPPTRQRWCNNGVALRFIPAQGKT
jgi:peptide-methionine (R)-S-oxide reductase